MSSTTPSAESWFAQGRRVAYDPLTKCIVPKPTSSAISVFERTVEQASTKNDSLRRWITFLPGFPEGSYTYSKVLENLQEQSDEKQVADLLFVEYVGQGDSDKPKKYPYSTVERADLVEAQWKAHNVRRSVVVTFDYSSIVVMELLKRQLERQAKGDEEPLTKIEHLMFVNGGYFADGHSHPWNTTPLLQVPIVGRVGTWFAQRSRWIFNFMMRPVFSNEYDPYDDLKEIEIAMKRRDGADFLALASGFVKEHKREGWNLKDLLDGVTEHVNPALTLHLVASEHDPFEPKQFVLAKQRLKGNVRFSVIPGGHTATMEQSGTIARFVGELSKLI